MSKLTQFFRLAEDHHQAGNTILLFNCPGCGGMHFIRTTGQAPVWTLEGTDDKPTVQPSVNITYPGHRCHFFIRAGMIEFLSDCDHDLAGKTVPMEPVDG